MLLGKSKSKHLKILVFFPPERSPGPVYRIEAYLKYLNVSYSYESIVKLGEENIYYNGGLIQKTGLLIKLFFRRFIQILFSKYDRVLINREAFPTFGLFFELLICKGFKKKLIYDFDDAIWIPNVSEGNKKLKFLKSFSKFGEIMKMADIVIAGNSYLADYAKEKNRNTFIIPSCIDLDLYTLKPTIKKKNEQICIGWCGSESTLQYLLSIKEILLMIQKKYGNKVYFKIIGSRDDITINGLQLKSVKWTKQNEVEELREFDIGIMPLTNDEWVKGKCSMKGIQYMGLAIPTIMSAVGMNTEVIINNENGYLAKTENDWLEYLSNLIEDNVLRNRFGIAGRKVIEERYSIQVWKKMWLELITQ
jgi:glycosyltransferase involved in cell wall biosynthesis